MIEVRWNRRIVHKPPSQQGIETLSIKLTAEAAPELNSGGPRSEFPTFAVAFQSLESSS
jgi:hypothetical protein